MQSIQFTAAMLTTIALLAVQPLHGRESEQALETNRLIRGLEDGAALYAFHAAVSEKSAHLLGQYIGVQLLGNRFKRFDDTHEKDQDRQTLHLPFDEVVEVLYEEAGPADPTDSKPARELQAKAQSLADRFHRTWSDVQARREHVVRMGRFLKKQKRYEAFKSWARKILNEEAAGKKSDAIPPLPAKLQRLETAIQEATEQWINRQWWLGRRRQTMTRARPVAQRPVGRALPQHLLVYFRQKNQHRSFDNRLDAKAPAFRSGRKAMEYLPNRHSGRPTGSVSRPSPAKSKLNGQ